MLDIAPEEEYKIKGKTVIVRRDDKAYLPPLPPNAKMAALHALVKRASEEGYKEVMIFAKKQQGTSYAIGLPIFAKEFGLHSIIVCPVSKTELLPHWLKSPIIDYNTETIRLHPNLITINVSQCKKIAKERGAYFIPFGFDDPLSIEIHANKFSLPVYKIGTLITATMTGMILAGTLRQINNRGYKVDRVISVSGGRPVESIYKSINKYLVDLYENQSLDGLEIFNPYDRNFKVEIPSEYNLFNPHPDYEAKAWLWMIKHIEELKEPIYFLNVGR